MEDKAKASRMGSVVIMSGPSGAGKSTVCQKMFARRSGIGFSVSCTTRQPRPGEIDGVHYYFLTMEEFKKRVTAGEFLEWAEVHGNCYGTLLSEVGPRVMAGEDVVLDIDVQGHDQIVERIRQQPWGAALLSVFLVPPSYAELERRLRGRGTDSEEAIIRRLGNAKGEMQHWRDYDYVVVNGDAEEASREFEAIIMAAHCRTATQWKEPWA